MPKVKEPVRRFIVRNGQLSLRTTFEGKRSEKSLGIDADGFDVKRQRFVRNKALNDTLKEILRNAETTPETKKTFKDLVWDYVESHELSRHTEEIWFTFLNKLQTVFTDVDDFDISIFVKHLESEGLAESTVKLYITKCKALGFVVPMRYRKNYRYEQREVWLDKTQVAVLRRFLFNFLNNDELEKIFKTNSEICALWLYYLCYLTALSPVDLVTLERKQISENDKCWFITGKRKKTKMRYKIPVLKNIANQTIFGKALSLNEGHLYFLPVMNGIEGKEAKIANRLSNKTRILTKKLKRFINEKANPYIEKRNAKSRIPFAVKIHKIPTDKLTFYSARHSRIISLLNESIPPAQLSLMLGRSINTISQYFHILKDEQFGELTKSLEDDIVV